jgi:hypothetical protein
VLNNDGFFYNFTIQVQVPRRAENDVYKIFSRNSLLDAKINLERIKKHILELNNYPLFLIELPS